MKANTNIRKIRLLRNYTQEYVAEQLGVSQKTYCNVEKGSTKLDVERLEKIAAILNVSVFTVLYLNEEEFLK